MDHLFTKKSGFQGLCGVNDFRLVLQKANEGNENAK